MYPNSLGWNEESIRDVFDPIVVEAIKKVDCLRVINKDCLLWSWSKDGNFSVRSCH